MPIRVDPDYLRDVEPQELVAYNTLVSTIEAGVSAGLPIGNWDVLAAFRFFRGNVKGKNSPQQCEVDALIHVPGSGIVVMDFTSKEIDHMGTNDDAKIKWLTWTGSGAPLGKFPNNLRQATTIERLTSSAAFRSSASLPREARLPLLPIIVFDRVYPARPKALLGDTAHELNNALFLDIWGITDPVTRGERLHQEVVRCFNANRGYPTTGNDWSPADINKWWNHLGSGSGLITGKKSLGLRRFVEQTLASSNSDSTKGSETIWRLVKDGASLLNNSAGPRGTAISGLAGTGKTWLGLYGSLATVRSAVAHEKTCRILFLCFSPRLRVDLEERVCQQVLDSLHYLGSDTAAIAAAARTSIQFLTPEDLAPTTAARFKHDPENPKRPHLNLVEFWLEAVDEARTSDGYDLIIIDEAQDFNALSGVTDDDVYGCIEILLSETGLIVLLGDPAQRTRRNQEEVPWRPPERYWTSLTTLRHNYRSPQTVVQWVEGLAKPGYTLEDLPPSPGLEVTCAAIPDDSDPSIQIPRMVAAALKSLKDQLGTLLPVDTKVLVNDSAWIPVIARAMAEPHQWPSGCRSIAVLSVDDYKGQEATFVVLVLSQQSPDGSVHPVTEAQLNAALYVGASRSRAWLKVIHDKDLLPD